MPSKSRNVSPCLLVDEKTDCASTHAKKTGDFSSPKVGFEVNKKNQFYCGIIKLGTSIKRSFASCLFAPLFIRHITHVVSVGANKKVTWVDTRRVVTVMTTRQSIRNWSSIMRQLPCNSVREHSMATIPSCYPVTTFATIADPRPTTIGIGNFNLAPESFFECLFGRHSDVKPIVLFSGEWVALTAHHRDITNMKVWAQ